MTTYTHTGQTPRFGHLRSHMRAYLFGAGATTALTAGALVVFLSLATFVAFKGLPFGGSSDNAGAAYLGSNTSAVANNTIGGVAAGTGNLISGNTFPFVISGVGATGNLLQGNRIGTNAAGTSALGGNTTGLVISPNGTGAQLRGTARASTRGGSVYTWTDYTHLPR